MNEKIVEFVYKAGGSGYRPYQDGEIQYSFTEKEIDKFAELIVRGVISVYNDGDNLTSTYDDQRVLEYFGVK